MDSLAAYFRWPQAEQHARAIVETKAAGKMLNELLSDGSNLLPQETAQLQRALTDLHLIYTSLLDQSLSNFSVAAESENGAPHHAA